MVLFVEILFFSLSPSFLLVPIHLLLLLLHLAFLPQLCLASGGGGGGIPISNRSREEKTEEREEDEDEDDLSRFVPFFLRSLVRFGNNGATATTATSGKGVY